MELILFSPLIPFHSLPTNKSHLVNIPEGESQRNITLVLKGINIYCDVAPGLIFYKAYEMDEINYKKNEIKIEFSKAIGLNPDEAGVKIIIADYTDNIVSGSHVARIFDYIKNNDGTITMKEGNKKKQNMMELSILRYQCLLKVKQREMVY